MNIIQGLYLLITLVFLGGIMPLIIAQVGGLYSQLFTTNPVAAILAGLIPVAIVVSLLIGIFASNQPTQVTY